MHPDNLLMYSSAHIKINMDTIKAEIIIWKNYPTAVFHKPRTDAWPLCQTNYSESF